jgi:hypothetical protein
MLFNKNPIHAKNECLYATTKKDSIFNKVYHVVVGNEKKMAFFSLFPHIV